MRSMVLALALIAGAVSLLPACTDEQLRLSIEQMNEGIMAFDTSAAATARQHFEEAVGTYPDNHAAWYYLGVAAREQNDLEKASEAFAEAVKIKKDEPMYQMMLGISLYDQEKYSLAEAYLAKAVELESRLHRAHWHLGSIFAESDRPEEAAQHWTQAAKENPSWGQPFVSLGRLYLRWDMIEEAIAVLEQGGQSVANDGLPDVYYYLGMAYDAQKNWDKAVDAYTQSIDASTAANSDNVEAKFQRALILVRQGENEKAIVDLEEVSKASPDPFTKQEANRALMELTVDKEEPPAEE
ncbi:tetratricopeptide repeat protein [Haliangium ochraceum]|uniref:Tetratricopeptide TPR_2 repeat protein n=1 Tax=Haliangium ochraceum (strain DSM 14365 / JCM 11303 / SMP-2) TaxID=502025 RepID=D0LG80_HALO1|nr:tetratricopeptide repeat protein [Haliangium ochraceum]ACY18105.1 Tetratricopeptide TPR_2 repeat protein [Haliangium ochraceum DSM 14365]